ncbi:hypothetical protein L1987_23494 [Smallanthus sonchifolius]|uniref:Uncharacterized protein n=1 Tax=Smallanthus sonchifolius TaxID=185202 RepID=A0ACB9IH39_9ASTR|nr:hypothetical protein L1987_23494 [Smallanthus sonchifolius]
MREIAAMEKILMQNSKPAPAPTRARSNTERFFNKAVVLGTVGLSQLLNWGSKETEVDAKLRLLDEDEMRVVLRREKSELKSE